MLTGDVGDSSKLPPEELPEVMQSLRDGAKLFSTAFPNSFIGNLDVYSGDGWQVLMSGRKRSLRAALFLRAVIRSYQKQRLDTRISAAFGEVDESRLNPERISESTGEAFTKSGRALNNMKKRSRLIWSPDESIWQVCFLQSAVSLVDELAQRWTARQAQTLSLRYRLRYRQSSVHHPSSPQIGRLAWGAGVLERVRKQALKTIMIKYRF